MSYLLMIRPLILALAAVLLAGCATERRQDDPKPRDKPTTGTTGKQWGVAGANICGGSLCVLYNRKRPHECRWSGASDNTPPCSDVTTGGKDCNVNTEEFAPPPRNGEELRQVLLGCGFNVQQARQRVCDADLCLSYSVPDPSRCRWYGETPPLPPCAAVTVGGGDCSAKTTDYRRPPETRTELRDTLRRCELRFGIPFIKD